MSPARLYGRLRLPWPAHVWALVLLVPVSVGLAYKVFIANPGPYGNWITYHRVRALNAAEIAGRQPPKYSVSFTTPAGLPPVVEANESRYVSHFRYLEYDLPPLPWALGATPRGDASGLRNGSDDPSRGARRGVGDLGVAFRPAPPAKSAAEHGL